MIRLPGAQFAIIEERKIADYLLSSSHPAGRAKAAFFRRHGFTAAAWMTLRDALLDHARSAPVISAADTPFGRKYILEGALAAPDGRMPRIRTVWFIEIGETAPRFVTAYPVHGARR